MNEEPKDYRLDLRVRNNRILHYMRLMGYETVAEFSRASGIQQGVLGGFVNLKRSPISPVTGTWLPIAVRIADALACPPDLLWSDAQREMALASNVRRVEVSEESLRRLVDRSPSPEEILSLQESRRMLGKVLRTLTPREEAVIVRRFGIHDGEGETLDTVGKTFNISRERVRQIASKGLRKLRRSCRARYLRCFNEEGSLEEKRGSSSLLVG